MENPKIDEYEKEQSNNFISAIVSAIRNLMGNQQVSEHAENLKIYMQPGSSVCFTKPIKEPLDFPDFYGDGRTFTMQESSYGTVNVLNGMLMVDHTIGLVADEPYYCSDIE